MLCNSKLQHFVALFFQSSNYLFITEKKHRTLILTSGLASFLYSFRYSHILIYAL